MVKEHNEAVATGASIKILEDLISALNMEAKVRDIRMGLFHTAVLTVTAAWQLHSLGMPSVRSSHQ